MLLFYFVGKILDEDDNTKAEAAKMQKEFDIVKDSTKEEQPTADTSESTTQSSTEKDDHIKTNRNKKVPYPNAGSWSHQPPDAGWLGAGG